MPVACLVIVQQECRTSLNAEIHAVRSTNMIIKRIHSSAPATLSPRKGGKFPPQRPRGILGQEFRGVAQELEVAPDGGHRHGFPDFPFQGREVFFAAQPLQHVFGDKRGDDPGLFLPRCFQIGARDAVQGSPSPRQVLLQIQSASENIQKDVKNADKILDNAKRASDILEQAIDHILGV